MRNIEISVGEHYHIYNRGNQKQPTFLDDRDRIRFLFIILHFQSPTIFYNLGRPTAYYVRHRVFNIEPNNLQEIHKNRFVDLVAFALMPNHFHLIVGERKAGGIAQYMQRALNAYTKYFNAKYKKSGHLFQGPYQAVHIEDNEQLLHLSAYIHRNPHEIKKWHGKEDSFPWSSYQDYVGKNRWGELLAQAIIKEQFDNKKDYRIFIETSGTKELN